MSIAKRNEGKKVNSNINVTPMVDVMLVLLIIFMVITPMLGDKITVDLPKVNAAVIMDAANKEDAITVAVTRDGSIFVRGDKAASLDDVTSKVQALEALKTNPGDDKSVYLRADTRANFGRVEDAIDAMRTAGVNQLNLMTDKSYNGQ
ncbi:MAG: biopolymer transporter ExbD [Acidobacteria bacterium]|nr:biopolymer transporter ExbD [Acidobacteriota bacterium]